MLKKLVGYAAYFAGATSFVRLLTFGVGMLGAKLKSREVFGDYNTYVLIYAYAQGFFIFGVNQAIQKFGADDAAARQKFGKLAVAVFLGLLIVTTPLGIATFVVYDPSYGFALFAIPWVVIWWWTRYLYRSTLNGKGEAFLTGLASLGHSIFTLAFIGFTDLQGSLIYGDFAALLLAGLVSLYCLPKACGADFKTMAASATPRSLIRQWYAFSKPMWAAGQVHTMGTVGQGFWTRGSMGAGMMGTFGFANQLWNFAAIPMDTVAQAALPGLVQAREDRGRLYRELVRLCLIVFPIIGIAVAALLPLILWLLDSIFAAFTSQSAFLDKYPELPLMLMIMALSVPLRSVEIVANQYAVAEGRKNAPLAAHTAAFCSLLATLPVLSYFFGIYGVMASGALTELVKASVFIKAMYRDFRSSMRSTIRWGLAATGGVTVAIGLVYASADHKWPWLSVGPAILAYVLVLVLTKMINQTDVARVRAAIRERQEARRTSPRGS